MYVPPCQTLYISYIFYSHTNFNKPSIKYQSYSNATKIDAFEPKIWQCHSPTNLTKNQHKIDTFEQKIYQCRSTANRIQSQQKSTHSNKKYDNVTVLPIVSKVNKNRRIRTKNMAMSQSYQSYPKSTKIDAFEQKIWQCHSPTNRIQSQQKSPHSNKKYGNVTALPIVSKVNKNRRIRTKNMIMSQSYQSYPKATKIVAFEQKIWQCHSPTNRNQKQQKSSHSNKKYGNVTVLPIVFKSNKNRRIRNKKYGNVTVLPIVPKGNKNRRIRTKNIWQCHSPTNRIQSQQKSTHSNKKYGNVTALPIASKVNKNRRIRTKNMTMSQPFQSYPKSTKIDAFEQKIWQCHSPTNRNQKQQKSTHSNKKYGNVTAQPIVPKVNKNRRIRTKNMAMSQSCHLHMA